MEIGPGRRPRLVPLYLLPPIRGESLATLRNEIAECHGPFSLSGLATPGAKQVRLPAR